MIRVAVDAQIADTSRAGIGQYTAAILAELSRDPALTVIPLRPRRSGDFSMPRRLWWDQVTVPYLARQHRADVILKTGFSTPAFSSVPVVTVLHDLAARRFPHQLHRPSAWFFGRFAPWTLRWADRVVTISDFTRREAIEQLTLPSDQLMTVYLGCDENLSPEPSATDDQVADRLDLPSRYILHIGTIEPRKNLAFLIRAFNRYAERHPDDSLLLVGRDGWHSDDVHAAAAASRAPVRFLDAVDDAAKRVLLRRARVLAFPSQYEGFGLPPLEAMRSGVPVVASRHSSIPEVVGDAGILLDGYDEQVWADALSRAADDGPEREQLRQAGLRQAEKFSWPSSGRAISQLLQSLVHG
ncbi:MAG: glycosyltransferase family 4 protein [Candidatus Kerfeldbacteria bacterium]|nr:glycosyltransferase family 4 protein [Candidatus Kerfeldbacteria bacterium]